MSGGLLAANLAGFGLWWAPPGVEEGGLMEVVRALSSNEREKATNLAPPAPAITS